VGWKRFRDILYPSPAVLLSENQCGMETINRIEHTAITVELSENQCGMETRSLDDVASQDFVEREPMWDDRSGCEWCVVSSEW
jgi:hypothetical protein